MNIFTFFEIIMIIAIIIMQTIRALKATKKIKQLKAIVPKQGFFQIKKFNISAEYLQKNSPSTILGELNSYVEDSTDEYFKENIISLIEVKNKISPIFNKILIAINVYLLKNKGATTDFNLIKDITERNIDMEEEEINQTITTPLYLGLMGTILGIIFGLINFIIASNNGNDFEIQGFLVGVSIAMFASVYGLFWTVLNSNFRYKSASRVVEDGKNDFYTFVQTELLPVLSLSESSGFYAFNSNLMKFNEDFTINIDRLSGLLHKNYDAIEMQGQILQNLENIDITSFAKANITILNKLTETTKDLSKFNEYIQILNSSVVGTTKLSGYFMALLEKTDNFKGIAEKLDERVALNNGLLEFLKSHFEVLHERGVLITDTVKNVDDIMIKSLDELREHTAIKIKAIKEVTIREEDLMVKTFEDNRSQLANLSLLNDLTQKSDELKKEVSSKLERNEKVLEAILGEIKTTNRLAKQSVWKRSWKWITKKNNV
ncbi:hypothetical protein [Kordia jejudonensis]|uniref:hypothetical protein n=1 Tax=Kordia jejudonensis TaxID=1348245 RepID=UPI00138E0BE7|nr:hypothetical protein [Kordia jejudonensis]